MIIYSQPCTSTVRTPDWLSFFPLHLRVIWGECGMNPLSRHLNQSSYTFNISSSVYKGRKKERKRNKSTQNLTGRPVAERRLICYQYPPFYCISLSPPFVPSFLIDSALPSQNSPNQLSTSHRVFRPIDWHLHYTLQQKLTRKKNCPGKLWDFLW